MEDALLSDATEEPAEMVVLIVMADVFFRKRLRRQLQDAGYGVTEALSVERALARVASEPPDAVLLDTWTNGGEGVMLIEAMRASPEWRHLPVLIFGNEMRPHVIEHAQRLGALGPVPIDDITSVDEWVRQALGII